MPQPPEDVAYLSIVRWPKGFTREQMTEALVEATGMDPFLADQRIAKGVPAIVHRLPASLAPDVLRHLYKRKVIALAPTRSEMEAVPPPARAKCLAEAVGAPEPMYMCEMWRAEPRGLKVGDIFLIVRARLHRSEVAEAKVEVSVYSYSTAAGLPPDVDVVRSSANIAVTDVMDLYLRDGSRIRISGDKFNFAVLGAEKGFSDNENADKLALRLAEQSPRILIDTKFQSFICPVDFISRWRTAQGSREVRDDHAAFDFYSVWACMVYRKLATGGAAREK